MTSLMTSLTPENVFKGVTLSDARGRRGGNQQEVFRTIREELLTTLHGNIRGRFPRVDILEAMQVC